MRTHHLVLLTGFGIFSLISLFYLIRVVKEGRRSDPSQPEGRVLPAVVYALTASMSPLRKETAYLHVPTYTAGLLFHVGTFLSFGWLAIHLFQLRIGPFLTTGSAFLLMVSAVCGLSILIKRIVTPKMRMLSNPDDYASNLLVTGFQALSALTLLRSDLIPVLFIYGGVLFLYIPASKLRHTIYFFTSRIHLGIFYGRRGIWPPGARR